MVDSNCSDPDNLAAGGSNLCIYSVWDITISNKIVPQLQVYLQISNFNLYIIGNQLNKFLKRRNGIARKH